MREAAFVLGYLVPMILGVVSNRCRSRIMEGLEVAIVPGGGIGQARPRHATRAVGAVVSKGFELFQLSGEYSDGSRGVLVP